MALEEQTAIRTCSLAKSQPCILIDEHKSLVTPVLHHFRRRLIWILRSALTTTLLLGELIGMVLFNITESRQQATLGHPSE